MVDEIASSTLNTELRDSLMEFVDGLLGGNGITLPQNCDNHSTITKGFEIAFLDGTSRLVIILDREND